jgi:hypothetical protein
MNGQASNSAVEVATRRLRAGFVATYPDESELRNAICAFVDVVKPLGWSIERVLLEVKRVAEVEDGFLYRARRSGSQERRAAEGVLERAVRWCIEHYFWTPPSH